MYTRFLRLNTSLLLVLGLILASGCVSQKKKTDVGALGKGFHNMTARYNGYYNATNLVLESQLELENQYEDNYQQILPIYKYVAADNPKAVASSLDEAIVKVTTVVNLHEISRWTDDCYLLAGQAQFLKQEYESAEETLEFLIAEYSPQKMAERESINKARGKRSKEVKKAIKEGKTRTDDGEKIKLTKKERQKMAKKKKKEREKARKQKNKEIKKRRKNKGKGKKPPARKPAEKKDEKKDEKIVENNTKEELDDIPRLPNGYPMPGSISLGNLDTKIEDGDPEDFTFKHRPAYQEGVLWLARTYIERENYTNADRLLSQLERNGSTHEDVRREVAIAKAHYFMVQKKYEQAAAPLQSAIDQTKNKQLKARLNFVLGQIHQENKKGQAAFAAFEEVLKNSPAYEMEFNARLNLALAGVKTQEESKRQLERMLKDEKNIEFKDQIYYALAEIDLQQKNKKAAIENLEASLANGGRNKALRAETYLLLADLYFNDEKYVEAKSNYDSALSVISKEDERYDQVETMAQSLEGIAANIKTIALQDSLLVISRMTEEEKLELALKIQKEEDRKRLEAAKAKAAGPAVGGNAPSIPGRAGAIGVGKSNFWAYDDRNVKKGIREFQRKWGSRELADNWRLSNQQSIEAGEIAAAEERSGKLTEEDIERIFKDVPKTPEDLAAANRKIETAMFNLGTQYRDKLNKNDKSIETLLELLNRYPETQYTLDAYYYLYLNYKDVGDYTNEQIYYDKIVNGYPNTNYARMLKDPNFALELTSKEGKLVAYYNETYSAFEKRQFQTASERISKVNEMFGSTNKLQPRFALLNAMCIGNIEGKDKYIEALKNVIAKHPEEPEAIRAREILRLLGERIGGGPGQQRNLPTEDGQVGNFKVKFDQLHYVIVVFKNDVSLNDAKVAVAEYNGKYHSLQRLRMNNIYLGTGDNRYPIVAIRRFKNKDEAMDYFDGVGKNKQDFLDEKTFQYELFAIGQNNYRELLKSKNIDDYRKFFELNYFN